LNGLGQRAIQKDVNTAQLKLSLANDVEQNPGPVDQMSTKTEKYQPPITLDNVDRSEADILSNDSATNKFF